MKLLKIQFLDGDHDGGFAHIEQRYVISTRPLSLEVVYHRLLKTHPYAHDFKVLDTKNNPEADILVLRAPAV